MSRSAASRLLGLSVLVGCLLATPWAEAGRRHHFGAHHAAYAAPCGPAGCAVPVPAEPQVVTKTIMVPQTTYKTMTVSDVVCKPELRQKMVTCTRMIPETTMVTRPIPVVTLEPRTRIESYRVCHMSYETVTETIQVPVPHTEMRQGVKTVAKPVYATEMRTVCRPAGRYEPRCTIDCHGCAQTCSVWVPGVETVEVPVTVCRPEFVEVPYSYPVTTCKYEPRTVTRQIPRPTYETKTREVAYTVPVTKYVDRQVPHTVLKPVTEEKMVTYTEMVPTPVQRTITVPICTLVPQEVTCTVGCATCGN